MPPLIPRSHPRAESLLVRERLVGGFDGGLVAKEGLLAHGRGEAFDYLLGERTTRPAKRAITAAAARILLADRPVISINGNVAALCPRQMVRLGRIARAQLEVNLFYSDERRKRAIARTLEESGASGVLGIKRSSSARLPGIDSARRVVDKDGILAADVVVVPLEDGDRAQALKKAGKTVIAFDLNPLSRTSRAADITIVDNVTRAADLLASETERLSKKSARSLCGTVAGFDNKRNLQESVRMVRDGLTRRGGGARIA